MKQADEYALDSMAGSAGVSPAPRPDSFSEVVSRSTEGEFDALFESSGEALVIIDASGLIRMANRRGREMLRLKGAIQDHAKLAQLLGYSPDQLKKICSLTTIEGSQSIDAFLPNGFPIRITLRAILPGSKNLLLCLDEGPLVQRADARWRQVEAELRSLLDSVEAGIVLFDPSGRVRFSSLRFGQFFGLDARDLEKIRNADELGMLVSERLRNPQSFSTPWKTYLDGKAEPAHDELEITMPAPRVIERFSRPVLDLEGRSVGWIETYSDVTGERQIRSKMLQTEKMAALGQLVSGIAHELNNPLTAIMGYAQLLLGHGLSQAQLSEASKVYQEAERARRIVKNLLYFARETNPSARVWT